MSLSSRADQLLWPISLRTRLTLWVLAVFCAIQLVTGAGFWYFQRASIVEAFDQRLLEHAQNLSRDISQRLPDLSESELSSIASRQLGAIELELFEVDIVDAEGRSVIFGVTRWPKLSGMLARDAIASGTPRRGRLTEEEAAFAYLDGHGLEAIALPIAREPKDGPDLALLVVTTDAFMRRQLRLISQVLIAGGLFGLLASTISGWFIAGIAVEPIHRLSRLVGQLSPENIDQTVAAGARGGEVNQLTEELNAARERIGKAFAAQERFLSNISHEIKTPIATLLTEAQTLDRSTLSKEALGFVDTAEDEMRKLSGLVESFLTLTRVRDGKGIATLKPYMANELVMDSVEDCRSMAEQYAVRLLPTLAAGDEGMDASVLGDPTLLRTMLNNLIRNAIRFCPRGAEVEIVARLEHPHFVISIADEGPGLPAAVMENLFDRFVQSPEEMRRGRGHGLGLAIAKGIAELHRGDITARNRPMSGAEFIVVLPMAGGLFDHPDTQADSLDKSVDTDEIDRDSGTG